MGEVSLFGKRRKKTAHKLKGPIIEDSKEVKRGGGLGKQINYLIENEFLYNLTLEDDASETAETLRWRRGRAPSI